MNNIDYIDGQNLYLWIQTEWWTIDLKKFRVYLKDKFGIQEAYYFLWYLSDETQDLYSTLQKAGFIVLFREHTSALKGKKKGNVDVDIVFEIMRRIIEEKDFDKIVLVSGDGDYIKLVKYLILKGILQKILFPNNNNSSLYNKLGNKYYSYLGDVKSKISYNKKRGS